MIEINTHEVRSPDGRVLLSNLSFRVNRLDRVAFIGPNGCGKSTLLRQLASLESRDNEGSSVQDQDVAYIPTRALDLLLPWGTVADNVYLFSQLASKRKLTRRSTSWPDFLKFIQFNLTKAQAVRVYNLSSGQQAILALHCALMQKAEVLIADEIFATLSEDLRASVADYLRTLGITVICASHDSAFIRRLDATIINLEQYVPAEAQWA